MTLDEYLQLITSQHRRRPLFRSTAATAIAPIAGALGFVDTSMLEAWDLDTAVGVQLDQVGEWIGATRYIEQPLKDLYFTWNDKVITGWEHGYWQGKYDPDTGIIAVNDDTYRTILYAKIASNNWDGTRGTMTDIWNNAFGNESHLAVIDHLDMSITLVISGLKVDSLLKYVLLSGRIPLKPEGVRIREYIVNDKRVFGFDAAGPAIGGFDEGEWATNV